MSNFTKIVNEETGNVEFQFQAELVSINTSEKGLLTNKNGKEFRLGTINFVNQAGKELKNVTTMIYVKSLEHGMKPGNTYLSTVSQSIDEATGKPMMWIRTSHLASGYHTATAEDFGLDFAVENNAVEATADVAATA